MSYIKQERKYPNEKKYDNILNNLFLITNSFNEKKYQSIIRENVNWRGKQISNCSNLNDIDFELFYNDCVETKHEELTKEINYYIYEYGAFSVIESMRIFLNEEKIAYPVIKKKIINNLKNKEKSIFITLPILLYFKQFHVKNLLKSNTVNSNYLSSKFYHDKISLKNDYPTWIVKMIVDGTIKVAGYKVF